MQRTTGEEGRCPVQETEGPWGVTGASWCPSGLCLHLENGVSWMGGDFCLFLRVASRGEGFAYCGNQGDRNVINTGRSSCEGTGHGDV